MNILIMGKRTDLDRYITIYYDTLQISFLGLFLEYVKTEFIINWAIGKEHNGSVMDGEAIYEITDGNVKIYSCSDYTDEDKVFALYEYNYENAFTLKIEKFVKFAHEWKEFISKNPKTILIKQIGDEIYLEDISLETFYKKVELSEKTKQSIDASFSPKIKNGLFHGGFVVNNDKNIKKENFMIDYFNVCSANINLPEDYIFNHAFFPENSDSEMIKTELISYFESNNFRFLKEPNFLNSQYNKNYFIKKIDILGTDITIFLNKNFELIGFYPIFRKLK